MNEQLPVGPLGVYNTPDRVWSEREYGTDSGSGISKDK